MREIKNDLVPEAMYLYTECIIVNVFTKCTSLSLIFGN